MVGIKGRGDFRQEWEDEIPMVHRVKKKVFNLYGVFSKKEDADNTVKTLKSSMNALLPYGSNKKSREIIRIPIRIHRVGTFTVQVVYIESE